MPSDAAPVSLPNCIGETFPGTNGIAWYWKTFHLSELPERHFFRLCFEAADDFAEAWLNGDFLGGCESGLLPFRFEAALRIGENRLAVRVENASKRRGGIAAFGARMERREPYTADLCILAYGERRMLLSSFDLLPHFGEDPASDLLTLNMLHYMAH